MSDSTPKDELAGSEQPFVQHLVDSDSGVGTQFFTGKANADGKPDIVTANKHGVFVFTQK